MAYHDILDAGIFRPLGSTDNPRRSEADAVADVVASNLAGFGIKPVLGEGLVHGTGLDRHIYTRGEVEAFKDVPFERRGTSQHDKLSSLIDHANAYKTISSAGFLAAGSFMRALQSRDNREPQPPKLIVVYDYNNANSVTPDDDEGTPLVDTSNGWHRAELATEYAPEWLRWLRQDGQLMDPVEFAFFIEDNVGDLGMFDDDDVQHADGDLAKFFERHGGIDGQAFPNDLKTIANGLTVHENVKAKSGYRTSDGAVSFEMDTTDNETIDSATGERIEMPQFFTIVVPVFYGGDYIRIPCQFIWRRTSGGIRFGFRIWRPERAIEAELNGMATRFRADTDLPLYLGEPEAARKLPY
jgi:hypothetical protein